MNSLPALTTIANAAIRRWWEPQPEPLRPRYTPPSWRAGLAALLERAAHAVAPVGPRPAH